MPASPFTLQSCHRTKPDGSRQDGWQVVQIVPGKPDPIPLHEPWYGVFSKQMANSFLDGVLLMFFLQAKRQKPPDKPPAKHKVQELQFS